MVPINVKGNVFLNWIEVYFSKFFFTLRKTIEAKLHYLNRTDKIKQSIMFVLIREGLWQRLGLKEFLYGMDI